MKTATPFNQLFENMLKPVYTCDTKGYINYYNKAAASLWGRNPEKGKELWCGSWKAFLPDGTLIPNDHTPMANVLKTKQPVKAEEIIIQRPDGTYRYVRENPSPIYDESGNFTGGINILVDITDRIEKERHHNNQLKTLVEQAADGIFLFAENGRFLSANKSGANMLGYSIAELMEMNISHIMPLKYAGKSPIRLSDLYSGRPILIEREFVKKDGTHFYTELSARVVNAGNIQAIVRDITERKNTDLKIAEAIERYEMLSKATGDTILDWDIIQNRIIYSDGLATMFGYAPGCMKYKEEWWKKNIHPSDLPRVSQELEDTFSKKKQQFQQKYRFRCADHRYKYILHRAHISYLPSGNPSRMISTLQDITYQQEEENRISKAMINAQEQERQQLGIELHDNINQILTGCMLTLGMIKNVDDQKGKELAETSKGYVQMAIEELRRLSHRLAPASFIKGSVEKVFIKLVQDMNPNDQFKTKLNFAELNGRKISEKQLLTLHRILQEQMTNILKYSKASTVEVSIKFTNNHVIMRTYDNGQGFDKKAAKNGIGLCNIKKRVQACCGSCSLTTSPGNGCEMIIRLPLNHASAND